VVVVVLSMGIQVREKSVEKIEVRLAEMNTALNKIMYLESALNVAGFDFEIKRFIWRELSELYEERKMFERAARAMSNKAGMDIAFRERVNDYICAAELFSRAGKVEDSDEMFSRALRDADVEQRAKIKLARKNIYSIAAKELESKGKKASAVKFYERLIKMDLEDVEKVEIKSKLLKTYNALGMFREAKLLEGI
jgi:tetratricopeptide (TPR) repeat protein